MKRDMDLARKILLEIEKKLYSGGWVDLKIKGYAEPQIVYHVKLLAQAGLIEANDVSTMGGVDWRAKSLTWQGHEFLDASRDEGRWEQAKNIMTEKAGGISFDVLKAILIKLMEGAVLG